MAESQTGADDALLATITPPVGIDQDSEALRTFVTEVLADVRDTLDDNRESAESMGMSVEKTVSEVFSDDNVRDINVRAKPFENPHITVWLRDCPTWANDAGNDYCYPRGLNAYNGKTNYVWDVRPF